MKETYKQKQARMALERAINNAKVTEEYKLVKPQNGPPSPPQLTPESNVKLFPVKSKLHLVIEATELSE